MTNSLEHISEIRRILAGQRAFFDRGETSSVEMRVEALQRLEMALREHRDDVLDSLATDLGKPGIEAFLAEYHFLIEEIRLIRRSLKKWLKPRGVRSPFYFQPCRSQIQLSPHGVALVMSPWNYPIQLSLSPLVAAVAAGNTVVLKPSEMAPASEQLLAQLIGKCFPPEHVAVVTGGADQAAALLDQPFDFIFFTGSTKIGRLVAAKAALHLTPTVLELGGKCPCVVDRTADLKTAAKRILIGKLFNSGQTCFAPDFVVAHEEIRDELVAEIELVLREFPWEQEMAKMINARHFERLQNLLSGKEIRKGEDDVSKLHFAPRILPDANWGDPAMTEEIFGPILPVLGFSDLQGLIQKLREFPSPLALYCFSKDARFIEALMAGIRSGSVCVNDTMKQACNLDLPFGGVGNSGSGRYRSRAGVETFSYQRAVTKRYFLPDPFEALPPRESKLAFLKKWLR